MKNLNIVPLLFFAGAVLSTSCKDFLDRQPFGDINSETFYTTEHNLDVAAVGMYGTLQDIFSNNFYQIAELPGDNMSNNSGDTGAGGQLDEFSIINNNSILTSLWSASYRSILQTNKILESLPHVEFSNESKRDQIEGEARFIRALNYFNMVRWFGDVPLDTLVLTPEQVRLSTRTAASKVYEKLIDDLKIASEKLPGSYTGNGVGRATKWTALSLLGKVYLTRHEFDEAIDPLYKVISEGPYRLLENYADIFAPSNANHAESVFEIQFEGGTLGEGSRWSFTSHNRSIQETMGISTSSAGIPTSNINTAFSNAGEVNPTQSPRYAGSLGRLSTNPDGTGTQVLHIRKHYMDHTFQNASDDNWLYLRYADVLMMYAEVLNETSATPPAEAIEYVNQIRRRAFGLPINTVGARDLTTIQTADKEAFRQAIYLERRLEFAFEGQRWFDLVRTDTYVEVMNAAFPSYNVQPYHRLYPVPQREIDINPRLLPNNEGYN